MRIELRHGLPFVEIAFSYNGVERKTPHILIDTGSAATLLAAEIALELGLEPELTDVIRSMRGIGGEEFVYEKKIKSLKLGDFFVPQFTIQIGAMDYGMEMNGILGMDFLMAIGAVIDLKKLEIYIAN
jgi:Predicted aspartyl protease